RVVFSESNSSQSVDINNRSNNQPYLINVGISDSLASKAASNAFMATPALFRVEPDSGSKIRIVKKISSLPRDRESVFYLNVMAIPASKTGDGNENNKVGGTLQVATGNTVKLFYRPDGLALSQKEAMSKLQLSRDANGLKVTNPTPYYVSLSKFSVDGKRVKLDVIKGTSMIAPFSSNSYQVSGLPVKAEWTAINDYGGKETFHGTIK
ncbi:TPA: molecular chaperone, partial [Escherichia coli]|nr:molecular chaperone [Escherichia coli]